MTQDHSTKLSFSIEESVWLNKGQEVDEIVSLSLDPEITVQEIGDYVYIRGGLKLTGEYRSNGNSNSTEEGSSSLYNQVAFRSIEEVTMNEDGTGEIRHNFPIDVTIPKERINSLDDIYVLVEAFDYDLPERGCIQFTADVAITGMSAGKIANVPPQASDSVTEPIEYGDRAFHYEAYTEAEPELVEVEEIEEPEESVIPISSEADQDEAEYEEEMDEDREQIVEYEEEIDEEREQEVGGLEDYLAEFQEENRSEKEIEVELSEEIEKVEVIPVVPKIKIPSVSYGVIKDRPKQEVTEEVETTQLEQKQDKPYKVLKSLAEDRPKAKQEEPLEEESSTEEVRAEVEVIEVPLQEEVTEVMPAKEENALYLTKMLTKGEEQFKKLKMCIIQEDETLDIIAARYHINQSTLIRMNSLNDGKVEEGQILYIPVTQ